MPERSAARIWENLKETADWSATVSPMLVLSSRSRGTLFAAFLAFGLLAFATPADAQVLEAGIEITAGEPTTLAMPDGDAASIPINITYQCGGLSGTVNIEVSVDANATGASASAEPASFEAVTPPDCEVGAKASAVPAVIKVTGSKDVAVGGDIPVKITVTGNNPLDQEQKDDIDVAAQNGPYLEVTFSPGSTEFEVPAGERADAFVDVTSNSNVKVMVMPAFPTVPEGWSKPQTVPINIESPQVEDANGTSTWQTEIVVPPTAEPGEYEMVLEIYAHTMGDIGPTLESEKQQFTYTITVTPGAGGADGEDEESPAPSVFVLAILGAALVGLLRRRL